MALTLVAVGIWVVSTSRIKADAFLIESGWAALEAGDVRLAASRFSAIDAAGPGALLGPICWTWDAGYHDQSLFYYQLYLRFSENSLAPFSTCIGDVEQWGLALTELDDGPIVYPAFGADSEELQGLTANAGVHSIVRLASAACLSHLAQLPMLASTHLSSMDFTVRWARDHEQPIPEIPDSVQRCIADLGSSYTITDTGLVLPRDFLDTLATAVSDEIPARAITRFSSPAPWGPDGQPLQGATP